MNRLPTLQRVFPRVPITENNAEFPTFLVINDNLECRVI